MSEAPKAKNLGIADLTPTGVTFFDAHAGSVKPPVRHPSPNERRRHRHIH